MTPHAWTLVREAVTAGWSATIRPGPGMLRVTCADDRHTRQVYAEWAHNTGVGWRLTAVSYTDTAGVHAVRYRDLLAVLRDGVS